MKMPAHKYRPFPPVTLHDRRWPSQPITHAPRWCSVDLRDGNQALVVPMSGEEKLEMFALLVGMGFKEIEVGFPAASQPEYDFIRLLIDRALVPADVTMQVLTQAREHLIQRTFESLRGSKKAIVHLYNSTSALQRRVVFGKDKDEIVALAKRGAEWIKRESGMLNGTEIFYEYSPESFTGTEPDFAVAICEAVMDVWQPTAERKMIVNLPSTVEMATPNVYADQIEWFCRHVNGRERLIISAHAHNDRGTSVAATELALMAGAERVEGTLFGNGERTGNVDIVTLALNLFSQGIDPALDLSDMNRVIDVYERCTKMQVPARHPYAGELVYTAFSGSHQDAINKGMKACGDAQHDYWEVPYLPIDPADVGRSFESVIRINSQSGKGGVAYIMEKEFGFSLPKAMHPEFGGIIQSLADKTEGEILPARIRETFRREYLEAPGPLALMSCRVEETPVAGGDGADATEIHGSVIFNGSGRELHGKGNGPINAFSDALKAAFGRLFTLTAYHEHAMHSGSDAAAAAYIQVETGSRKKFWGVGVDTNINLASFKALLSALNRSGDFISQGE
ncbi:MAG TPA: 2-isopropylmalate synthase [Dissulfurispiraceae bacterium]